MSLRVLWMTLRMRGLFTGGRRGLWLHAGRSGRWGCRRHDLWQHRRNAHQRPTTRGTGPASIELDVATVVLSRRLERSVARRM